MDGQAYQSSGANDAGGREDQGGYESLPDSRQRRVKSAVEEDQNQRDDAEVEGQAIVIKDDSANAVLTRVTVPLLTMNQRE
jgi:hypothetical protein